MMNGVSGYVVDGLPNRTLVIDFDGLPMEMEKGSSNLQDLQLAYTLTIHKAYSFMHHRNLLYPGVTSARHTTNVLGDHWGIQNYANRCQVDDRKTFLPLFLDTAKQADANNTYATRGNRI